MALSQKHRSNLYQHLAPLVGEEEAEALLSQFPSRDLDEPVTKEFVRAEIAGVRADVTGEINALRADVTGEISALRADVTGEINGLRNETTGEFNGVRNEITGLHARIDGGLAELRAELHDRLRQQTIWIASAMAIGMGIAAGLGRL
jgi:hypothetical protein